MKICHPSTLTTILLFHQTFASQEKPLDHFGFIQQKENRNRKTLSRGLQFVTPDFVCDNIDAEQGGGLFEAECSCTVLSSTSGDAVCVNTCESCLENDEGVTECFLESGTTSFTIDGLTGLFGSQYCYELITDDENDGKEVCFVNEEVNVDFLNFEFDPPTAGVSIDGELCQSFTLEGECATVDCSNLGYSSDWDSCDDSTYSGNEPLTQAYEYLFYPDEDLTLGTCLDDAVPASPSPTASPSMSPTVSAPPSKFPTASPSTSPVVSAAPSKSPTASPSMSPTVSAAPSKSPTASPTSAPTKSPTAIPSSTPSKVPTRLPTSTAIALSGSYVFSSVVAIIFLPVFL